MADIEYKAIENIAESVRSIILPFNNQNNNEFISNVQSVLRIQILYTDSDLSYGYIKWNQEKKKPEIIIYRRVNKQMQLFTIAHELGHLFLHWKWLPDRDLSEQASKQYNILDAYELSPMYRRNINDNSPEEEEANEFAGSLLMPKAEISNLYQNSASKNLDQVKRNIAPQFNVTPNAAFTRLDKLNDRNEL